MMNGKRMIRAGALSLALALLTVPARGQAQEAVVATDRVRWAVRVVRIEV